MSRTSVSAAVTDHYRQRFLAEMLNSASADQMDRRAAEWEWVAPKPGDFTGRATEADLAARTERCRATAAAFRAKATVLRRYGVPDFIAAEVATVLAEVA